MEMLSGLVEPQYQVTEEMFYKLPVTNTENHPAANCLAPQSFKSFIKLSTVFGALGSSLDNSLWMELRREGFILERFECWLRFVRESQ